jgi:hypothetical protein
MTIMFRHSEAELSNRVALVLDLWAARLAEHGAVDADGVQRIEDDVAGDLDRVETDHDSGLLGVINGMVYRRLAEKIARGEPASLS